MLSLKILFINLLLTILCNSTSGNSPEFQVYWNIPTFMCNKYNFSFENMIKEFGIIGNKNNDFRGDKIAILYDPGKFPAILINSTSKKYYYRNSGVPQSGNLKEHLNIFMKHLNELITDENFSGLGVIDFESWRPTFRQNFGILQQYKNLSIRIEKLNHPRWSQQHIKKEAARRFEIAGRIFMEQTINLAQKLRPNAKWGYYAFPYCFNRGVKENCSNDVRKENDGTKWLYNTSDIVLPSVYLQEKTSPKKRLRMVKSRILEAIRVTMELKRNMKPKIFVYYRYLFTDTLNYISETETIDILNTVKILLKDNNVDGGIILWGSSSDLNKQQKCDTFFSYLLNTLGPAVESMKPNYSVLTTI